MAEKKKTPNIDEQQVADFLTRNSSFFNDYPKLLLELSLPYKDGKVLSLSQKQVEVLRTEVATLKKETAHMEQRLASLMKVVDKNEKLTICLHRLSLKLLFKREVEAVVCEVVETLRMQFPANQIIIRLFSPYSELSQTALPVDEKDPVLKTLLSSIFNSGKPDCGPFSWVHKKVLFGNFALRIRSAVVMPLQFNKQKIGLLLLGSPRAEAFVPGKGAMLLVQFGELIAVAIASCTQNSID